MQDIFIDGKRRRSLEIARLSLPVLVYYASVLNRPTTYQQLAKLVGCHQRNFQRPFGYIHEWIKILEDESGKSIPAIPLLVFQKGRTVPAIGGVEWLLKKRGFSDSDIDLMSPTLKQSAIDAEVTQIKQFLHWNDVLEQLNLVRYVPPETSIVEITKTLSTRKGSGESPEHKRLKEYIAHFPETVGISKGVLRTTLEFILPSLDKIDILFETEDAEWICVEVKAFDADEPEITRGLYQCVKYEALARALRRDLGEMPRVRSLLAMEGSLSPALVTRRDVLNVEVIAAITVSG
jgi:hypothetical protein